MRNKILIYCDFCNWKKIIDDSSKLDIVEVKSEDKRKFKCPSCGRLIISKKISDPQAELEHKIKKEKYLENYQNWIKSIVEENNEQKN